MKLIGFIKEADSNYGFAKPLKAYLTIQENKDKDVLVRYLEKGHLCVALTCITEDKGERMGSISVFTDGEWCWPQYIIGYLKKYSNLHLQEEFLQHVLETKTIRAVEPTLLLIVEKEFLKEAGFK